MNIFVLCLSPGKGGLEFYIKSIAINLSNTDFNFYYCVKQSTPLDTSLSDKQNKKIYLDKKLTYLPLLSSYKLAKLIDQLDIDIIFLNWAADLPMAAMAKTFSRKKPTLIYSRHMKITRSKHDFYHRWIYRQVDLMLTITNQLRREALEYLPLKESQVKKCYLGVKEPPIDKADCGEWLKSVSISQNSFRVALFGRIEHGKGQHILVEALHLLNQKGISIQAAVIGHVMDSAYYENLLQQTKEHGLDDQLHFLEFVSEPMDIMHCFDVVVLTTYEETFGLVLVEAMRCGVTVIGTRAGGVMEIIDEDISGMLFSPGDPKELSVKLLSLLENPAKRKQLAVAGKARADELFDEKKHFTELAEILSKV